MQNITQIRESIEKLFGEVDEIARQTKFINNWSTPSINPKPNNSRLSWRKILTKPCLNALPSSPLPIIPTWSNR